MLNTYQIQMQPNFRIQVNVKSRSSEELKSNRDIYQLQSMIRSPKKLTNGVSDDDLLCTCPWQNVIKIQTPIH